MSSIIVRKILHLERLEVSELDPVAASLIFSILPEECLAAEPEVPMKKPETEVAVNTIFHCFFLNPYLKRDCANVLILFSVNDDYQAGSSFPAFNFTGLDSISKPSGGNDMGGFGFNF